jgi:hypothetical protein
MDQNRSLPAVAALLRSRGAVGPLGPTDGELLASSLDDPEAFTRFFERHWEAAHRFCSGRAGAAGADIAAESFRVAFDRRSRFDASGADARPWLFGIANRLLERQLLSAEALGVPLRAVNTRIHRAQQRVRTHLAADARTHGHSGQPAATDGDLSWVAAPQPGRRASDPAAHDRALLALLCHMSSTPAPRRGRHRPRTAGGLALLRLTLRRVAVARDLHGDNGA